MLLSEVINKAENGDVDAMKLLGDYYSDNENEDWDVDLAIEWYEKAANKGHVISIYEAARLLWISARVENRLFGTETLQKQFSLLDSAIDWVNVLKKNEVELGDSLYHEIMAEKTYALYCEFMLNNDDEEYSNKIMESAIDCAIEAIGCRDSFIHFAIAFGGIMFEYTIRTDYVHEYAGAAADAMKVCLKEYNDSLDDGDRAMLSSYLGYAYTLANGVDENGDMAYKYFLMASDNGYDASKELSWFKKDIFGHYKYVEQ